MHGCTCIYIYVQLHTWCLCNATCPWLYRPAPGKISSRACQNIRRLGSTKYYQQAQRHRFMLLRRWHEVKKDLLPVLTRACAHHFHKKKHKQVPSGVLATTLHPILCPPGDRSGCNNETSITKGRRSVQCSRQAKKSFLCPRIVPAR